MNIVDEIVDLLEYLADKYQFEDADLEKVQQLLFNMENTEALYDEIGN